MKDNERLGWEPVSKIIAKKIYIRTLETKKQNRPCFSFDANPQSLLTISRSRSIPLAAFLVERKMRHHDYVPPGLEKVFAAINAYRRKGTSGFYGDEDCMHIPLREGWYLTMAREGTDLKAQLSRKSERVGDVETFKLEAHDKVQEWLYVHGV